MSGVGMLELFSQYLMCFYSSQIFVVYIFSCLGSSGAGAWNEGPIYWWKVCARINTQERLWHYPIPDCQYHGIPCWGHILLAIFITQPPQVCVQCLVSGVHIVSQPLKPQECVQSPPGKVIWPELPSICCRRCSPVGTQHSTSIFIMKLFRT